MTFSVKPTINVGDDSLEILNSLGANKIFFVTDPFVVESKMIDQVISLLDKIFLMIFLVKSNQTQAKN